MRPVPVSPAQDTGLRRISARCMTTVLDMSAGRSPDVRPVEAMRLMAAVAGVVAVIGLVVLWTIPEPTRHESALEAEIVPA